MSMLPSGARHDQGHDVGHGVRRLGLAPRLWQRPNDQFCRRLAKGAQCPFLHLLPLRYDGERGPCQVPSVQLHQRHQLPSHRRQTGYVKAETCDKCRGYVKILYQVQDPALEPLADDVATLGLDMLMAEDGWKRGGQNPLLMGY
jgi:Protein involved in formate dehydrogenase formation